MEAFAVKILPFLLIVGLLTSQVVDGSPLLKKNKNGNSGLLQNNTEEVLSQNVTGIRKSTLVPHSSPDQPCYVEFFAAKVPPNGLRRSESPNSKYICQNFNSYATMFDESLGIPVFSAYTLTKETVDFEKKNPPGVWKQTYGIKRQGSDEIYPSLPYHRGHLAPAHTLSGRGQDAYSSTYKYTNAVPQRPAFNSGKWSQFEKKIRKYATDVCIPKKGTLFLLTGTSFVHREKMFPVSSYLSRVNDPQKQPWLANVRNNYEIIPDHHAIAIPSSLWTAGCCVYLQNNNEVIGNFAVFGNNVQDTVKMDTDQVQVAKLEDILKSDIHVNGKPNAVKLFPAFSDCADNSKNKVLN